MGRETRQVYLRSAQLKYKLSDMAVGMHKSLFQLRVTGYIQSDYHHNIDHDNWIRWLLPSGVQIVQLK